MVITEGRYAGDAAAILISQKPVSDPIPGAIWQLEIIIGEDSGVRRVAIDLPPILSRSDPVDLPVFVGEGQMGRALFYYRNRLFLSDRCPRTKADSAEITLRLKKAIYDEEVELSNLRGAVSNLEAAIEYQRSGAKRDPIPDDVKLVVWARDGGACVRCGARQELHFDHIIPLAKGGGNTEANIQILCQPCNLRKSDKIGA